MGQYLPIVVMAVLAVAFGAVSVLMSRMLAPRRATEVKSSPYESGIVPQQGPPERFPVRFYLIAMIFVVFDIEVIFLYPFATVYRELSLFGLVAILIFAVAVFESFVYLLSKGALDWGPASYSRRSDVVDPGRTATTTIRRVGLEGREPTGEVAA
ncbi:MAG TPA: NADH-quinone oxidoreductase subunit A [Acidimicrobiales bacterium]|nr:NADH-quinone oxidoreductase subunit A [Acidimicrobiales bacterium]